VLGSLKEEVDRRGGDSTRQWKVGEGPVVGKLGRGVEACGVDCLKKILSGRDHLVKKSKRKLNVRRCFEEGESVKI